MLHAINQNKSHIYERYLGHRDKEERQIAEEDEITALLLGPLALILPASSALFWHELLKCLKAPGLPDERPISCVMDFWPRRRIEQNPRRSIEPDIMIKLQWEDNLERTLVVELKWNASLSEDQLQRQWAEYLNDQERKNGWHLFIGKEISKAHSAKNINDIWGGRIFLCGWTNILNSLESMKRQEEFNALFPWADQVSGALNKLGFHPFSGFENLPILPHYNKKNQTIFFREFLGFSNLSPGAAQAFNNIFIFFNEQKGVNDV